MFLFLQVIEKKTKPHIQLDIGGQMKTFAPEEISAMVLVKMKETAEAYLGKKVMDINYYILAKTRQPELCKEYINAERTSVKCVNFLGSLSEGHPCSGHCSCLLQ